MTPMRIVKEDAIDPEVEAPAGITSINDDPNMGFVVDLVNGKPNWTSSST